MPSNCAKNNGTSRHVELMVRMEAAKLHKTRKYRDGVENGFTIPHVKEAHKYLQHQNKLTQEACDIYITQELLKHGPRRGATRKHLIQKSVKKFLEFDSETKCIYLSAALVSMPSRANAVASDAFDIFLALHAKQEKCSRNNNEQFGSNQFQEILKNAKLLWKTLTLRQKLPFYMLGHLNGYLPREMDGSTRHTFSKMSDQDIQASVSKATEVISRTVPDKPAQKKKHVRFVPNYVC